MLACSTLQPDNDQNLIYEKVRNAQTDPLEPEETKTLLKEVGNNWLYGHGLGSTVLNVGAITIFPPYAVYIVGNTLISAAGYQPLEVTSLLPEEEKKDWDSLYDTFTSGPGRVAAAIGEKEFRTREVAKARIAQVVSKNDTQEEFDVLTYE